MLGKSTVRNQNLNQLWMSLLWCLVLIWSTDHLILWPDQLAPVQYCLIAFIAFRDKRTANFEILTHPLRCNWFKCCPFNWPHIVDDLILYCKWSDIIGLPGRNASIIQETCNAASTPIQPFHCLHCCIIELRNNASRKDFDHQWVTDNAPTLKSSPLLWRDWIKCHHPPSPPHHPPPQPLIQISPTWQFASWHRWKKWINTERIINSASPNPHHNQCKHHHHGTLN